MPLKITGAASLNIAQLADHLKGADGKCELRGDQGVLWVKEKSRWVTRGQARDAHRETAQTLVREALIQSLRDLSLVPAPGLVDRLIQHVRQQPGAPSAGAGDGKSKGGNQPTLVRHVHSLHAMVERARAAADFGQAQEGDPIVQELRVLIGATPPSAARPERKDSKSEVLESDFANAEHSPSDPLAGLGHEAAVALLTMASTLTQVDGVGNVGELAAALPAVKSAFVARCAEQLRKLPAMPLDTPTTAGPTQAPWLRAAQRLAQPHPQANSAQTHVLTRADLQALPMAQRANLLLALAIHVQRVREAQPASVETLRESYAPYLHLAGAFSADDMLAPSERALMDAFLRAARDDLSRLWGRWPGIATYDERKAELLGIVNRHAAVYGHGDTVPTLQIDGSLDALSWRPDPSGLVLIAGEPFGPAASRDFATVTAHLLQGLGRFRQMQLVRMAHEGTLPDDPQAVALARVFVAIGKSPIDSAELQATQGLTQRQAREVERSTIGLAQLTTLADDAVSRLGIVGPFHDPRPNRYAGQQSKGVA